MRRWLGWGLAATVVLLMVPPLVYGFQPDLVFVALSAITLILGWLITTRVPENIIGPVLLLGGLSYPIEQASIALTQNVFALGSAPYWMAVYTTEVINFIVTVLVFSVIPQIFPTGKPLPRWRWLWWLTLGYMALMTVIIVGNDQLCIQGSQGTCIEYATNPLGAWDIDLGATDPEGVAGWVVAAWPFLGILGIVSVVARFRGSTGDERQQLRWYAAGVAGAIGILWIGFAVDTLAPGSGGIDFIASIGFSAAVVLIIVSVGVAVLKYRLYDLGKIVSRTTAYTVVAIILAVIFFAGVALTQQLLPVEGQFGIVVSTLVVAALFNPLRRRVQSVADRRFNRSRYDAQLVLDDISDRLREDVDRELMQAALLNAALETMRPSYASVWIQDRARERE